MADPAAAVAAIEGRAEIRRTPCGAGAMVWHIWGRGSPLVLLHGGYGSWTHWIRNVLSLAEHRRVLVPDLPGLGDSDPPPEPDRPEAIAAVVASGLALLIDEGEAADIAGFSFGGLIGGLLAHQMGAKARSITLVGSGGLGVRRRNPVELINWREHPDATAQRDAHRENLAILMFADRAHIDDLAVHLQVGNAARARVKSRVLSRIPALPTVLPQAAARLNGIWGERDITAQGTLEEHRRLIQSLQPGATFTVIAGAGHLVQYEAALEFNGALLGLLST
jgi:2-hydroxy-6-oxonona-2,4-dienedioate hydrolase